MSCFCRASSERTARHTSPCAPRATRRCRRYLRLAAMLSSSSSNGRGSACCAAAELSKLAEPKVTAGSGAGSERCDSGSAERNTSRSARPSVVSLALGASESASTCQAAAPPSPSTATSCGASTVGGGSENDAGSDWTLSTSVNLPTRPPGFRVGLPTRRSSSSEEETKPGLSHARTPMRSRLSMLSVTIGGLENGWFHGPPLGTGDHNSAATSVAFHCATTRTSLLAGAPSSTEPPLPLAPANCSSKLLK